MRGGGRLRLETVTSFWWRRPQPFRLPPGLSPQAQQFALTELATAIQGMWQASEALWVNDIVRDAAAARKPFLQTLHGWRETRRLTREDLGRIETVRLAPVIFQALVPGVAGPRVTGLPISAALVVRLHAGRRTMSHAHVQPLRRAG